MPIRPGSEEYLDSEKYEIKKRTIEGPLLPLVKRLNEIRRANRSLQRIDNVTFLDTANDQLIAYAKQSEPELLIVCVNLDPSRGERGTRDGRRLARPAATTFVVQDLLTDVIYDWHAGGNYVLLPPGGAHVLHVR